MSKQDLIEWLNAHPDNGITGWSVDDYIVDTLKQPMSKYRGLRLLSYHPNPDEEHSPFVEVWIAKRQGRLGDHGSGYKYANAVERFGKGAVLQAMLLPFNWIEVTKDGTR